MVGQVVDSVQSVVPVAKPSFSFASSEDFDDLRIDVDVAAVDGTDVDSSLSIFAVGADEDVDSHDGHDAITCMASSDDEEALLPSFELERRTTPLETEPLVVEELDGEDYGEKKFHEWLDNTRNK